MRLRRNINDSIPTRIALTISINHIRIPRVNNTDAIIKHIWIHVCGTTGRVLLEIVAEALDADAAEDAEEFALVVVELCVMR